MEFVDILLFLLGGSGIFFIGIPFYKLMRRVLPSKRDTLAEAKERLEQARLDAEAARLNKEAEKIYDHLYEDALQKDDEVDEENEAKHRRV
jgi:hypothetical protein